MLSKNLLYTAVTRGKRLVVLVCDPRAVQLALTDRARQGKGERRTELAARLASDRRRPRSMRRAALTYVSYVATL